MIATRKLDSTRLGLRAASRFIAFLCLLLAGPCPVKAGGSDPTPGAKPPAPTRTAGPGQVFRLVPGESIYIERAKMTVRLKKLIYSPCPKGARCVWSGLGVMIEVRRGDGPFQRRLLPDFVGRRPYPPKPAGGDYIVSVTRTDLKTFAELVVHNAESWCRTRTRREDLKRC